MISVANLFFWSRNVSQSKNFIGFRIEFVLNNNFFFKKKKFSSSLSQKQNKSSAHDYLELEKLLRFLFFFLFFLFFLFFNFFFKWSKSQLFEFFDLLLCHNEQFKEPSSSYFSFTFSLGIPLKFNHGKKTSSHIHKRNKESFKKNLKRWSLQ